MVGCGKGGMCGVGLIGGGFFVWWDREWLGIVNNIVQK